MSFLQAIIISLYSRAIFYLYPYWGYIFYRDKIASLCPPPLYVSHMEWLVTSIYISKFSVSLEFSSFFNFPNGSQTK